MTLTLEITPREKTLIVAALIQQRAYFARNPLGQKVTNELTTIIANVKAADPS